MLRSLSGLAGAAALLLAGTAAQSASVRGQPPPPPPASLAGEAAPAPPPPVEGTPPPPLLRTISSRGSALRRPGWTAVPVSGGVETHDGFYLRFALCFGSLSTKRDTE